MQHARPSSEIYRSTASASSRSQGRGDSRGRGRATSSGTVVQPHQNHGQSQRGSPNATGRGTRGSSRGRVPARGRGSLSQRFSSPPATSLQPRLPTLPINPPPDQIKEHNDEALKARRAQLKDQYEGYKKSAIQHGLMSGEGQSSLEDAIKTKGTCTQMCDEKERVDRIFEGMLDRAEMLPCPATGKLVAVEGRMVKRFRRSAAGVDKQLPEELRTPHTLKKTLDYLFDEVIGKSDRLAKHHKFVWDRTRAIRNDFSIQSFTKPGDVRFEVDCLERIVRFHILSAHQLSNPLNLGSEEEFSHAQEMEQLQKTYASLLAKYDGFRNTIDFHNEPEFRAYFILFSLQLTSFDIENQIQYWPKRILNDGRVQTALKLYAAAGNTHRSVGASGLGPIPCSVAQANSALYWSLLDSNQVGYLMACVAEMNFQLVRFTALDALWRSAKSAPERGQANMRTWTTEVVTQYLCFDQEDQTEDFCAGFDLAFNAHPTTDDYYLDFKSLDAPQLDISLLNPKRQVFSNHIVEEKRHGRSLVAVINGMSVAQAKHAGMVEDSTSNERGSSMFVGDYVPDEDNGSMMADTTHDELPLFTGLNPAATNFTSAGTSTGEAADDQPKWMTQFGQTRSPDKESPGGPPRGLFGSKQTGQEQHLSAPVQLGQIQSPSLGTTASSSQPDLARVTNTNTSAPAFAGFSWNQQPATFPATNATGKSGVDLPQSSSSIIPSSEVTSTNTDTRNPIFNWPSSSTDLSDDSQKPVQSTADAGKPSFQASPLPVFKFNTSSQSVTPSLGFQPVTTQPGIPSDLNFASSINPTFPSQTPPLPAFSFQPSSTPSIVTTTVPAPPVVNAVSSAPQFSTRGLSTGSFHFPGAPTQFAESTSTTPVDSPARPIIGSDDTATSSKSLTSPSHNSPSSHGHSSTQQSVELLQPPPIDEEELLTQLCRIGLVQQDGVLDMFVAHKVSKLVQDVFHTYHKDRFDHKSSILKAKVLGRKFFTAWRLAVEQRRMKRKARRRREMLATTYKEEEERRQQRESELAKLLEFDGIKKEIADRQAEEEQLHSNREDHARLTARTMAPPSTNTSQHAGQKRKLLTSSTSRSNLQGISMTPKHKRSKTLGSNTAELTVRAASTPSRSPRETLAGSTNLRRSISQKSLRQSNTQQRLDQTQSDYFRLKAHGIDPETPLFPDTAVSLATKKRTEAAHRAEVMQRITKRPASFDKSRSSAVVELAPAPAPVPASITIPQPGARQTSHLMRTDVIEDLFLKQLREAREALSADADWFKTQTDELEKEVEQQEQFRHSLDSVQSIDNVFAQSINGFARSVSGREYVPPELRPGQTLSRTEERIRRTGARGLATKPIGGTPLASPQPEYRAVAMSRRSASQLMSSSDGRSNHTNGTYERKRSIEEVQQMAEQVYDNGLTYTNHAAQITTYSQQAVKKPRVTMQALENLQSDPTTKYDPEAEEEDEEEEGEEEEVDDGDEEEQYAESEDDEEEEETIEDDYSNGVSRVYADQNGYSYDDNLEGEEYDEDAEDELEEEIEDGEDQLQYAGQRGERTESRISPDLSSYTRYDDYDSTQDEDENGDLMPPAHGSRAVSSGALSRATPDTGVGSTVNDAIELSD